MSSCPPARSCRGFIKPGYSLLVTAPVIVDDKKRRLQLRDGGATARRDSRAGIAARQEGQGLATFDGLSFLLDMAAATFGRALFAVYLIFMTGLAVGVEDVLAFL